MQSLIGTRHFIRVARLVAMWFAMALTVAAASPIVQPRAMELICSASGVFKLIVRGDERSDAGSAHTEHRTLDCALCLPMAAPPPASTPLFHANVLPTFAALPAADNYVSGRDCIYPPPRGPPSIKSA